MDLPETPLGLGTVVTSTAPGATASSCDSFLMEKLSGEVDLRKSSSLLDSFA